MFKGLEGSADGFGSCMSLGVCRAGFISGFTAVVGYLIRGS